jgi:hypothetical protein
VPHFGLMDEEVLGPEAGPLQRARLHIRAGRRRLRQGKISAGIVTLYDAMLSALRWYTADPGRKEGLDIREGEDLTDDKIVFGILRRSRVLDGRFDYAEFDRIVEWAMDNEMPGYDHRALLKGVEHVMTELGVMPFEESELPAEDPSTF